MFAKPNSSFFVYFTTQTPATGAAVDADALPTAAAYKNGALDAAFVLTVAGAGSTGVYKVSGTVPVGYAAGDWFDVVAVAIVGGVTGRAVLGNWLTDTKRTSELVDAAAAPTVGAIRAELDANSTKLDVAVSTRAAAATALSSADWTGVRAAKLDNLDASVSSRMATFGLPANFSLLGISAAGKISGVVLTDTVTTYTGNTPQTGDTFARVGLNGLGLSNLGDSRIANLNATISSRMATFTLPTNFADLAITFDGQTTVGINNDKTDYFLEPAERSSIADAVQYAIIEETDGTAILAAIVAKIAELNPTLGELSLAAIAEATRAILERAGGVAALTQTAAESVDGKLTTNRAAKLDNLDVAVSTRAAAATALSSADWSGARAAKLDNLDAAVSTRNATAPPTVGAIRAELDANSTKLDVAVSTRAAAATALSSADWTGTRAAKLDNLDAAVSTRAESFVYTAPDNVAANAAANAAGFAALVAAKLETALELDGAVYRLTANALELGPAGGSAGALTEDQAEQLAAVYDRTASGDVTVLSPITREGGAITAKAGDSWEIPIAGLGSLVGATRVWFSVKTLGAQSDAGALLFIEAAGGLHFLNGALPSSAALGALEVDDDDAGDVVVSVDPAATVALPAGPATWAIKVLTLSGVATLARGSFEVTDADIYALE